MPYYGSIPQDVSGQLFAQGMSHGINSLVQGYNEKVRKDEEDKDLLARARATASFIKTHPDLFGGEDEVKRITAENPNESPRQTYFRQQDMMANVLHGEKIKDEQAQRAAAATATALNQFHLDEAKRQRAETDALNQNLDTFMQGGQGQQPQAMPQMAPQAQMATDDGSQVTQLAAQGLSAPPPMQYNGPGDVTGVTTAAAAPQPSPGAKAFIQSPIAQLHQMGVRITPEMAQHLTQEQMRTGWRYDEKPEQTVEERTTPSGMRYLFNPKTGVYQISPMDKPEKDRTAAMLDELVKNKQMKPERAVELKTMMAENMAAGHSADPNMNTLMAMMMFKSDPELKKMWDDAHAKGAQVAPAAGSGGDGPTLRSDQVVNAKAGPFVGINGKKYIKNADGSISLRQ